MALRQGDRAATGSLRWWGVIALSISVLAVGIDLTVLNVALPTLAGALHASTSELQWFVDAYSLVLSAALLPAGVLGDRYGRKKVLIIGLVVFGVSSAACASASSSGMLIATRAVLGLGAAIIIPLSLSVLAVMFPEEEERQKAVSAITAATLLGYPLGPVLGGWLLSHYWWGSVFLINVPVVAIALLAVIYLIPESHGDERRALDMVGVALSGVGLAGVTYGLIEAGQKGWGQAGPLAALLGGVLLLVCFVIYETRLARQADGQPLVDFKLFRSSGFTWGTLMATIVSFVMLGLLFVVPQYLQEVLGASTLGTGVRLLPVIGGLILGAVVAIRIQRGRAKDRIRFDTKVLVAAGFVTLAAGAVIGLNTTTSSSTGFAATWLVVGGVGLGLALPTAMNAAIGAVSERESGAGASLIWVFRQVGGTFGVAVLGTVLSSTYRGHLRDLGLPAAVSARVHESITEGVAVAHSLGSSGRGLLEVARAGFVDAMDVVLVVCGAIAVAGAVLVWVVPLGRRVEATERHGGVLTAGGREDGGAIG